VKLLRKACTYFHGGSTYVVAGEVVDGGLSEHAVVLELRLAERRGVASNDDELGLAGAEGLEGGLVAKSDLAGLCWKSDTALHGVRIFARDAHLDRQRQLGVDAVGGLCALLWCHCAGIKMREMAVIVEVVGGRGLADSFFETRVFPAVCDQKFDCQPSRVAYSELRSEQHRGRVK